MLLPVLVALAMLLPAPSARAAAGEAFEIRQLRCEGAACTTAEGIMPGLTTLEVQGALRDYREQGLRVVVEREGASAPVYERRARASGLSAADLTGEWRGINGTAGVLQIAADGSYRFNGVAARYRIEGEEVIFGGPLAPWNDGRARLRSGVIEFYWKNREGFQNWFTFARVR
jgi:hypothetical protein